MPSSLLHVGATVLCAHGGHAMPTAPNPRVLVSGQPTVTVAARYTVTGCRFNLSGAPSPCLTAQWVVAAARVTSNGVPVVLVDGQAICVPNGTPLIVVGAPSRVVGM